MRLKKYQLSSVFLILFIFFLSNKNSLAIENKIILKVNNEIITSVDVFNEAKYLKTLNKNLKNISDKEIIKLAKNSLLREKIKIIELSKYPEVSVNKEYLENMDVQIDSELEIKFKENPNDLNTRYELAKSQIINKDYSESINNLLFIIEKNKDWNNNKAKTELLNIFSLLGDSDPLTMNGRSRLSNLIFK